MLKTESAKELLQLIQSEPTDAERGIVEIRKEIEPGIIHFFAKLKYSGSTLAAKSRAFREGIKELIDKGWLYPAEENPSTNTRTYEYKGGK